MDEINTKLAPMLTSNRDDKQCQLVMEYATISGAGKTRWLFNAFKNWQHDGLKASVVHINFNGADNSTDCLYVQEVGVSAEDAISRLLLSRGVLECSADLKWITEAPLPDKMLPRVSEVVDALFEARFGEVGKGLLIVHLDEFAMLRTARLKFEGDSPGASVRVDAWIKAFLQGLSSWTKPGEKRYIVPVLTHTNPTGRILGPDNLSTSRYEPLQLFPFTMDQSWALLIAARKNLRALTNAEVKNWHPSVALAGGHPSLLLDCYKSLTEIESPGYQAASVSSVTIAMRTNHRIPTQLSAAVTAEKAKVFVQDALTSRELDEGEHSDILDGGLAWFLPKPGRKGTVSAPFPYLLRLMKEAGGMYDTVARQLDA
eukprot:scaffold45487_cov40-Attheya_sp.AAC.2